jgi:hypothetical protein
MFSFNYKRTKTYIYISSKLEELCAYRISGNINRIEVFLINNPSVKLITLMKKLDTLRYITVETRFSRNKATGIWLWIKGYHSSNSVPSGTLGGLDYAGDAFSGEFNGSGLPIMIGEGYRNNQNAGAKRSAMTSFEVEWAEKRGKWSWDELELLRKWKREEEERKYDLRQKCNK